VAEVEHLVQPGELDGDMIHTPGVFVQRIIQTNTQSASRSARRGKKVMGLRNTPCPGPAIKWPNAPPKELRDGFYVNLGSASRRWCRTTSRQA